MLYNLHLSSKHTSTNLQNDFETLYMICDEFFFMFSVNMCQTIHKFGVKLNLQNYQKIFRSY